MDYKVKILLDIDGTLLINGKLHPRADELFRKHEIVFWSSEDYLGPYYSKKYNVPFIHKNTNIVLEADALIDDYVFLLKNDLNLKVKKYYESINDFLNNKELI